MERIPLSFYSYFKYLGKHSTPSMTCQGNQTSTNTGDITTEMQRSKVAPPAKTDLLGQSRLLSRMQKLAFLVLAHKEIPYVINIATFVAQVATFLSSTPASPSTKLITSFLCNIFIILILGYFRKIRRLSTISLSSCHCHIPKQPIYT